MPSRRSPGQPGEHAFLFLRAAHMPMNCVHFASRQDSSRREGARESQKPGATTGAQLLGTGAVAARPTRIATRPVNDGADVSFRTRHESAEVAGSSPARWLMVVVEAREPTYPTRDRSVAQRSARVRRAVSFSSLLHPLHACRRSGSRRAVARRRPGKSSPTEDAGASRTP